MKFHLSVLSALALSIIPGSFAEVICDGSVPDADSDEEHLCFNNARRKLRADVLPPLAVPVNLLDVLAAMTSTVQTVLLGPPGQMFHLV